MSQIKALLWEVWFANRLGIVAGLIFLPIAISLIGSTFDLVSAAWWSKINIFIGTNIFAYIVYLFGFGERDSKTSKNVYAKHILLLPISTWFLVVLPVVSVVLVSVLSLLFWLKFILHIELSGQGLVAIVLGISGLAVFFQALNWGGVKNFLVKTGLIAAVLCFLSLSVLEIVSPAGILGFVNSVLILGLILVLGIVFAYVSVAMQRSELVSISFGRTVAPPMLRQNDKSFKSNLNAQFWYERKVFGWLLPSLMIAITIAVSVIADKHLVPAIFSLFFFIMVYFPILAYKMAGAHMGKNEHGLSLFISTLPLSDADYAYVKLKLVGLNALFSVLICLVALVPALYFIDLPEKAYLLFNNAMENLGLISFSILVFLYVLLFLLFLWSCAANAVSLGLAGKQLNIKNTVKAFALFIVSIYVALSFLAYNYEAVRLFLAFSGLAYYLALFPLILFSVIAFKVAEKYVVQNGKEQCIKIIMVASAFVLACFVLIVTLNVAMEIKLFFCYLIMFLCIASIIPIFAAPLAVSLRRHC